LVRPSLLFWIASSELNGRPVLLTPSNARACSAPRSPPNPSPVRQIYERSNGRINMF
jgi:hypothetical protein